jgi:glucokinase
VVLGPGTGLGVGGLVFAQHTWIPVPGEGGHVDIGPRSERDFQIWPFLEPIEGRMAGEQILCGRGIMNLYRAVCAADGVDPVLIDPAEVTTHALAESDRAAIETISLFCTYLGRVAGDMALIFMARGGVFLAGGISQKILPALMKSPFRDAFEDKAPHSALMKTIPTFAVIHPMAALSGLAAFARTPRDFGVATEGRRWRS